MGGQVGQGVGGCYLSHARRKKDSWNNEPRPKRSDTGVCNTVTGRAVYLFMPDCATDKIVHLEDLLIKRFGGLAFSLS